MKLKYYMKGMGAGILFTLFIFVVIIIPNLKENNALPIENGEEQDTQTTNSPISSLLGNNNGSSENAGPISDSKAELTKEPDKDSETELTKEPDKDSETELTKEPDKDSETEPSEEPTKAPTATPTQEPTKEPTATPTQEPTKAPTATPTPEPTKAPTPTPAAEGNGKKFTFTITKGMSSETLCDALETAGIVKDGSKLNTFLRSNGYTKRIQTGTFTFTSGMEYEDIAGLVTGKGGKSR